MFRVTWVQPRVDSFIHRSGGQSIIHIVHPFASFSLLGINLLRFLLVSLAHFISALIGLITILNLKTGMKEVSYGVKIYHMSSPNPGVAVARTAILILKISYKSNFAIFAIYTENTQGPTAMKDPPPPPPP